jgi:hypothetical protein
MRTGWWPQSLSRIVVTAGLVASFAVPGCAAPEGGWTPLNRAALRVSNPRSIKIVTPEPAALDVVHGVRLSAIGAVAGLSEGESLRTSGATDPSARVASTLAGVLAKRFSLEVVKAEKKPEKKSDLSLVVETKDWIVTCGAFDSRTCEVKYHASLKLIDERDGKVLSSGDCTSGGSHARDGKDATSKLDAALVNEMFDQAADTCVEDYRTKLFSLPPS